MNRALAPLRGAALRAAGGALASFGGRTARGLTLVPDFLTNLLWLLSTAFLDLARHAYGGNSACYAVLRVLSTSVAEPPLLAYTVTAAGEKGDPLPYTHPLQRLIRQPNELQTQYEFWEWTTLALAIGGRAFWYKERNNRGEIISLLPLRPDRVGPIYSGSMVAGQRVIGGWSYHVPGTSDYLPLPRADVLAFNLPDPAGESGGIVEGLGPLQVLAAEVGADNEASRFVGAMLANYGAPGVVLTTKSQLRSEDDAKLIKAAFVREFGGARRGLPGVVDQETTITPVGFNLQQLEFPSLRKVAESRIAAAVGVPAILAGLQVGLESGIRATITEQRQYFTETTCSGYWRRYSDQYSADVAAEFGDGILCLFDMRKVKALQEQLRTQATQIEEAFKLGAVTVNEYREAVLELPPTPDGDVRVMPTSSVIVDKYGDLIGQVGAVRVDDQGRPPGAAPAPADASAGDSGQTPTANGQKPQATTQKS